MILVDANLLLYARNLDAPEHEHARAWLEEKLLGPARVGLPWMSLLAFLRIATHPRAFARPLTVSSAWAQVEAWLDAPPAWIPAPGERHRALLGGLVQTTPGADLVPDAHLAAVAIEHGLTLCSTDGDFARFAGLRWENPLAS
ncbi:MAG: type II toxin-antitoxin system VapC family toxin [Solirubrobacteraceae bacterium]